MTTKKPSTIEDVQNRADTRRLPINKVGIKDVYHPVRIYVALPHNFKGTHMSRFVEILHNHEREISVDSFGSMLREMTTHLNAEVGHIEMSFPFFVMKKAPMSGVESLMNYQASLIGEYSHGTTRLWLKVVVAATSLCPCSKAISQYGAHNQRSHITLTARIAEHMWLEELIDIAEQEASCEVYGIKGLMANPLQKTGCRRGAAMQSSHHCVYSRHSLLQLKYPHKLAIQVRPYPPCRSDGSK